MKLATLDNGTKDGRLVVVTRDLSRYADAGETAPTLQWALDHWTRCSGALETLAAEAERNRELPEFRQRDARSPLPRAYQWADGSAYLNHVELVRKARGATVPRSFHSDPLMYQGGSDTFYDPQGPIVIADEAWGIDLEAEVSVIVDEVDMGADSAEAARCIRLIMLVNDVSLRNLVPAELGKGFGFFHSKPSTAFSPVAVTPDELGAAWRDARIHLPLCVDVNRQPFGRANAGIDMTFGFGDLVAHAAKTRRLAAGTIIGSGTVSNKLEGGPGKPISEGGAGYSCIAEIRMIETIDSGRPTTPFLRFGDRVRIWMEDSEGRTIFGAIDQTVKKHEG
ncbi:MAG: fumarylacetoacetate hydrolase family protein [Rhodobacteraceae bacterium]|nr:fumarylacetoacetate hydrolase family protein [Paracoccaceae bacterium]